MKYSAILGLQPSKGARSPILWNAAYKAHGIESLMKAIDIPNYHDLIATLQLLESDQNFVGGAIAFPYKEDVFNYLDHFCIDKSALQVGAVNCIYRKNSKLFGCNTDGLAALNQIKLCIQSYDINSVCIVGYGGVGKAVVHSLEHYIDSKALKLKVNVLTTKNPLPTSNNTIQFSPYSQRIELFQSADLIVNCTDLGSASKFNSSIFDDIKISLSTLPSLKCFFDVVYQPVRTQSMVRLEPLKVHCINGLEMNLEQAIIAFNTTHGIPLPDHPITKSSMASIASIS